MAHKLMRVLAGVGAYLGFCVFVAGIQTSIGTGTFWANVVLVAGVVAAFLMILSLFLYAVVGSGR